MKGTLEGLGIWCLFRDGEMVLVLGKRDEEVRRFYAEGWPEHEWELKAA